MSLFDRIAKWRNRAVAAEVKLAAVVALGEQWVGFDDSHHYGDALLKAALGDAPREGEA